MNTFRFSFQLATICLMFLCSCATQKRSALELPDEVAINDGVARGDPLFMTLRLETGEELLFALDTGCQTILDRSLEGKLGKRLGTEKFKFVSFNKSTCGVYATPKLYLGETALLTGDQVLTDDLRRILPDKPVMGILGMDCLRHYCVQLDFVAGKVRFLKSDGLDVNGLGKAFPLDVHPGAITTRAELFGMENARCVVDTGLSGGADFMLPTKLYQRAVVKQKPAQTGSWTVSSRKSGGAALFDVGIFGSETFTNLQVGEAPGQSWNWVGLRFLARNLVTFNFPMQTMYLKRTSVGPLPDDKLNRSAKTATSASK